MMRAIVAGILGVITSAAPPAGTAPAPGATSCATSAYVSDPDPAGLNVRTTPRGKVLGVLPAGTEVRVVEHRGGWVRVEGAWNHEHESTTYPAGWVHPSKLGTDLKGGPDYERMPAPRLRSAPRPDAPGELLDHRAPVEILGCEGPTLRVRIGGKTGWLGHGDHCASRVTLCS